jgi:hypothetical protein
MWLQVFCGLKKRNNIFLLERKAALNGGFFCALVQYLKPDSSSLRIPQNFNKNPEVFRNEG